MTLKKKKLPQFTTLYHLSPDYFSCLKYYLRGKWEETSREKQQNDKRKGKKIKEKKNKEEEEEEIFL